MSQNKMKPQTELEEKFIAFLTALGWQNVDAKFLHDVDAETLKVYGQKTARLAKIGTTLDNIVDQINSI